MSVATEVVKIGGSLLTRDDFVPAIRTWLDGVSSREPAAHRVLVIGGGPLVDALRMLDAATPIGETVAHWQAIQLMEVTGLIVGNWLPSLPQVGSFDVLQRRIAEPGKTLFLPGEFLTSVEPDLLGCRLQVGWQVTSDSIAARLATCLGAGRLRLLKSREATPTEQSDWDQAVAGGLVDDCFPELAALVPEVRFETLPYRGQVSNHVR